MPRKSRQEPAKHIVVKASTYDKMDELKNETESWNSFFRRMFKLGCV